MIWHPFQLTGGCTMTVLLQESDRGSTDDEAGSWVSTHVGSGLRAQTTTRSHTLTTDEPLVSGGTDTGPTPYEYLLTALSGCMALTLRLYADRKGWPLESVDVRLRGGRSHKADCETCEVAPAGITTIDRKITLSGPLTDEQRKRLLQLADRCPVKQTLARGIVVTDVES
jgi:putative redox protein